MCILKRLACQTCVSSLRGGAPAAFSAGSAAQLASAAARRRPGRRRAALDSGGAAGSPACIEHWYQASRSRSSLKINADVRIARIAYGGAPFRSPETQRPCTAHGRERGKCGRLSLVNVGSAAVAVAVVAGRAAPEMPRECRGAPRQRLILLSRRH